jgi:predicted RNase H-like nuclease
MKFVGVDGCKAGWCAAWVADGRWDVGVYPAFADLWGAHRDAASVLVDIPIGLADDAHRRAEGLLRERLGPRRSSVFNTPARAAIHAGSKEAAKAINRKAAGKSLSEQSLGIMKKIAEVDLFLAAHPEAVEKVFESHPELCFAMAGQGPMRYPKRDTPGVVERYEILTRFVPDVRGLLDRVRGMHPASRVAGDDVFDALILAVTGRQGAGGLKSLPNPAERDAAGLPMAIWYAEFDK